MPQRQPLQPVTNQQGNTAGATYGYDYTIGAVPTSALPVDQLYSASRLPSKIYSDSLAFKKQEVSLSAMAFLFQEMISHAHKESKTVAEFESKLDSYGASIGYRLLELLNFRSSVSPTSSSRASGFLSAAVGGGNKDSKDVNAVSGIQSTPATPVMSGIMNRSRANTGADLASVNTVASSTALGTVGTRTDTTGATNTTGTSIATSVGTQHSTKQQQQQQQQQQQESLAHFIVRMKRRDLKILDILQFVHSTLWSYLFNHVSDDLVKSSERSNEYMIIDNYPPLTQFIGSIAGSSSSSSSGGPSNGSGSTAGVDTNVSCDYFVCGIIRGFLSNAGFPCSVTAHSMPVDGFERRLVYLIQFDSQVLEREGLRF